MKALENSPKSNKMKSTTRFEKTIRKDDMTKSICVEGCENGYIITFSKDYKVKDEWKYETKKYISKTNPLDAEEEKDEFITVKEFLAES